MEKKKIINNFDKACTELAEAVNEQLFEGSRDWYWVGDMIGGLCDFGDYDFLNVDDMRLILQEEITYDTYVEWREAGLEYNQDKDAAEQHWINLHSWLKGARYEMLNK